MATISEIQSALDNLGGWSGMTPKELMKKRFVQTMGVSESRAEKMAEQAVKCNSPLYTNTKAAMSEVGAALKTIPTAASSLAATLTSITGASGGTAAPAVPGMTASFRNTVQGLKSQCASALSAAARLGVDDLPVDTLVTAAKTLAAFSI